MLKIVALEMKLVQHKRFEMFLENQASPKQCKRDVFIFFLNVCQMAAQGS